MLCWADSEEMQENWITVQFKHDDLLVHVWVIHPRSQTMNVSKSLLVTKCTAWEHNTVETMRENLTHESNGIISKIKVEKIRSHT